MHWQGGGRETGLQGCLSGLCLSVACCLEDKLTSLGDEGWKSLTVGLCSQVFSTIQEKTMAEHLMWLLLRTAIIKHMLRPALVANFGPLAPLQVLQNSGSLMFILRVKTLSVRDSHWRNLRGEKYKSAAIGSMSPTTCNSNSDSESSQFNTTSVQDWELEFLVRLNSYSHSKCLKKISKSF